MKFITKKCLRNTINVIITITINLQLMFYYINWDNALYGYPTYLNKSLEYYDKTEMIWFFLLLGWFFWTILVWNGLNNGVKAVKELWKEGE